MSLVGALNVGQTALAAQQAAIQVTGNNIANVADPNYADETVTLSPNADQQIAPGEFVGTGVNIAGISQQIDWALTARLQNATSDNQAATTSSNWLTQIQGVYNALSGQDLGGQMSTFFNDWSNLANSPQNMGLRQVVLQDGATLANQFQSTSTAFENLQNSANSEIQSMAGDANQLAGQIAQLNGQIVNEQAGTGGTADSLIDQRNTALNQLSQLVDIQTVQQPNGIMNVYSGSQPLVLGTQSLGITVKQTSSNGAIVSQLALQTGGETLNTTSGQIGALISMQGQIQSQITQVNTLAHNLISAVNQLHSSGQGLQGMTSTVASNTVTNTTVPLNSPSSGLQYQATNGSFVVTVTNTATGLQTSTLIPVNLTGNPGDTTLDSLTASLNSVAGISATDASGLLQISAANSGEQISFSQDSSGVLAALGINSFFTGSDASNIAVSSTLQSNPSLLAAAQNGQNDDNQTALAIANLETQALPSLNGQTLQDNYQGIINGVASATSTAQNNAQATQSIVNTIQSQWSAISGVSIDQETINLIQQQGAFQGAARLITVVNDLMTTLMNM